MYFPSLQFQYANPQLHYLHACRVVITTQYYECLRLGLSVRLVHIIRQ
jgi:hypothetical protein